MKRVIDSSVAFKWVVPETDSDKALLLRDDFRNGLLELIAPDVFPIEVGHALTRAERQGRIPVGTALPLLQDILNTLPLLHPSLPILLRAVEISSQMRVGVYDCLYVALAEGEKCDFVTADDKLVGKLKLPHFPFIISLSSLP
jgi:predicted nucleic acid-binding protein